MADISLQYSGAQQVIDDMSTASQTIAGKISDLEQSLAPFAQQFVGQAATAYSAFQTKVNTLETNMQTALSTGSQILASMVEGLNNSDRSAAGVFGS
ncbi:WXG100 family type VII secretion target [Streptomyces sp. NPDC059629]|uniref:WXG100 family type VII secretion target n=1 Tax=Streptomyces sp. NPDC059629 TaxID=3346889 RepID=UPI0036948054